MRNVAEMSLITNDTLLTLYDGFIRFTSDDDRINSARYEYAIEESNNYIPKITHINTTDGTTYKSMIKKHMNFNFSDKSYVYTRVICTSYPNLSSQEVISMSINRWGDIGWVPGIIVLKQDVKFLQDFILKIS